MPETSGTSTVDVCPKIISISTPTKEDIDYARKLLQNPENIKQSDLRDNMVVREYNEKGEIVDTLRSAKLEREYQEWQREVKIEGSKEECAWDVMIIGAKTFRKWLKTKKLCASCSECIEEAITEYEEEIRGLKEKEGK